MSPFDPPSIVSCVGGVGRSGCVGVGVGVGVGLGGCLGVGGLGGRPVGGRGVVGDAGALMGIPPSCALAGQGGHEIEELLAPDVRLRYVGRREAASPATGSHKIHQAEEAAIVEAALRRPRERAALGRRTSSRESSQATA